MSAPHEPPPQLPDFSGGRGGGPAGYGGMSDPAGSGGRPTGSGGRPAGSGGRGFGGGDGPGSGDRFGPLEGSGGAGGARRGPLLALVLGGGGCLVVVLAVIALVLSQTVLRAPEEDPAAGGATTTSAPDEQSTPPGEYVPEGTDPQGGDGEVTLLEQPTSACTIHPHEVTTPQVDGAVRGGGLEFPQPEGWTVGSNWGTQSAYLVDLSYADQPVEGGWYSVVGVGAVEFPEDEGGYPGAQETARAIFQCDLSRDDAKELYDEPVRLTDYREEETTVDGHPAWIVSADVLLSDLALLHTTDAWRVVVIVVDTPDGPAAFTGGAALGHDQQVADLETMIEGLRVL